MSFVFITYTIVWAMIAGYIAVLGKRQKKLKQEIKQIAEWNGEH